MRNGNLKYRLKLDKAVIVHRGVSQGGRNLDPRKRADFWVKKAYKKALNGEIAGIRAIYSKKNNYERATFIITPEGLRKMREFSLVIVCNPKKPAVWTPKRILTSAKRSIYLDK
ncbi:MAG: hypothetical protein V1770_02245 [bacterium]